MTKPPFEDHDHAACIAEGLSAAAARCEAGALNLSPVRRRVLEILLEDHRALGAYDILRRLAAEGHAAQPPVAYRALDFLVRNGLAHKIERLSAYVACTHPRGPHRPAFLICRDCEAVAEAPAAAPDVLLSGVFGDDAGDPGFTIESAVIEAEGLCPACRDAGRVGSGQAGGGPAGP